MKQFYDITNTIKDTLEAHSQINTVTFGDIFDVDLNKQTIFPLGHIQVNSATINEPTIVMNISVSCMDIVEESKGDLRDENEPFFGLDNEQDILNTQLQVVNDLTQKLFRGQLHTDLYQIEDAPNCTPFTERFENKLTGWTATFDVIVPNTTISAC